MLTLHKTFYRVAGSTHIIFNAYLILVWNIYNHMLLYTFELHKVLYFGFSNLVPTLIDFVFYIFNNILYWCTIININCWCYF